MQNGDGYWTVLRYNYITLKYHSNKENISLNKIGQKSCLPQNVFQVFDPIQKIFNSEALCTMGPTERDPIAFNRLETILLSQHIKN